MPLLLPDDLCVCTMQAGQAAGAEFPEAQILPEEPGGPEEVPRGQVPVQMQGAAAVQLARHPQGSGWNQEKRQGL